MQLRVILPTFEYQKKMASKAGNLLKTVPNNVNLNEVAEQVENSNINSHYLIAFKTFSNLNDLEISDILDLNVKTYRSYKTGKNIKLSSRIKEHSIALFALFKHGKDVFGDNIKFKEWLNKDNFFFDGKTPGSLLFTISGIKFIDDRLTAMEFGDNV